jgi:hypothetical protein
MKYEKKLIAYLIQAHNQEKNLFEMVNKLNNDEVCFFIHIDKKSDINKFKNLNEFKNLYFVKNRMNVVWKGFSQVEATIRTIKLALNSKYDFKYFILLSGSDYPIKSNTYLLDFFKNTNKNFIEFKKIKKSNSYLDYFKNKQLWFKISKWHFYDSIGYNFNSKNGSFKHWFYRIYILINILIVNRCFKKRFFFDKVEPYFGSSWWNLNKNSIEYILDFYDKNCKFHEYYYYTDAPDEMYFQTIILNSKFKKDCVSDNLRYVDWSVHREGPAILDDSDFLKIKKSDKFIARKINKKSKGLKIKIDKEILKK